MSEKQFSVSTMPNEESKPKRNTSKQNRLLFFPPISLSNTLFIFSPKYSLDYIIRIHL